MREKKNLPTGFGWSQGVFSPQPHVEVPKARTKKSTVAKVFSGASAICIIATRRLAGCESRAISSLAPIRRRNLPAPRTAQPEFFLQNTM